MLVRLSGTLPVLDSVTVCGALAEPTFWLANIRAAGERVAPLRSAVPEKTDGRWGGREVARNTKGARAGLNSGGREQYAESATGPRIDQVRAIICNVIAAGKRKLVDEE